MDQLQPGERGADAPRPTRGGDVPQGEVGKGPLGAGGEVGSLDDQAFAEWLAQRAGDALLELRAARGFADPKALKDAGDAHSHELMLTELARWRPADAVLSEEDKGSRQAWTGTTPAGTGVGPTGTVARTATDGTGAAGSGAAGTGAAGSGAAGSGAGPTGTEAATDGRAAGGTASGPARPARLDADRVWIIDPLDGTREFSEEGRTDWAVHVALWDRTAGPEGGLVAGAVAMPARKVVLGTAATAPTGGDGPIRIAVSRTRPPAFVTQLLSDLGGVPAPMGSAGVKVCAVVTGEVDAYVHGGGQYEWDSAAPVAVAIAAGLYASRIDGSPLLYNRSNPRLPDLLVCRPELAERLLKAIAETNPPADATGPAGKSSRDDVPGARQAPADPDTVPGPGQNSPAPVPPEGATA